MPTLRLRIAVCSTCGSSAAARGPSKLPCCAYCLPAPRSRWKFWLVAGVVAGIAAAFLAR